MTDPSAISATPVRRGGRAWLFAVIFALLLVAGWLSGPAQAQDLTLSQTVAPARVYLPLLNMPGQAVPAGCPATSANLYDAIPIEGTPRPTLPAPVDDPDINLHMRGWVPTSGVLGLVDVGGGTHSDPPQLAHLFQPPRLPAMTGLYQVYEWDWEAVCAQSAEKPGCRGAPRTTPPVTALEVATGQGEPLYLPRRSADILNGVYYGLVLYAEGTRLTVAYVRSDWAGGSDGAYLLHLEELCVDPNLLALYQELHAAGRGQLPGLRVDVPLGVSRNDTVMLVIRDTGDFMDPRSRKDWWKGY